MRDEEFYRVAHRAYLRDGSAVHEGEALLVACLLHSKGKSRQSDDMTEVRKIMRDHNLDKPVKQRTTKKGPE